MRVLLDECVPRKLSRLLTGHKVETVRQAGFSGMLDGPLLDALVGRFDVLVTLDKSLRFQQAISARSFSLVVIRSPSSKLADIVPLAPNLLSILDEVGPRDVRVVEL